MAAFSSFVWATPTVSYHYVDKDGGSVLTSRPSRDPDLKLVSVWRPWSTSSLHGHFFEENRAVLAPVVQQEAREAGVPAELIDAIISAESLYDVAAVSSAGAVGLMQLMPETALSYGIDRLRDPVQNIRGGAIHMAYLLRRFDGVLSLSLAAYNAGETAVRDAGDAIPDFPETRAFVRRVIEYYRRYRREREERMRRATGFPAPATPAINN